MVVSDWMSTPAIATSPMMAASDVLAFMERHDIVQVVVVEEGKFRGAVEQGHLRAGLKKHTGRATVEDVMSKEPVIVPDTETLDVVARLMVKRRVASVTVVRAGQAVGVITQDDLVRSMCEERTPGRPQLVKV